ncbi:hypothetical protein CVT24_011950 [Panaeolus cyanescens]|uniref:VWFA domain-containing protein n=1 Tax=Panaeolus cyanescens TaxID=181874 RepID=A0A409VIG4_9AGAR|nr:hypothetical protein CVT24_011950 [Panaeolus cyanescens]
MYTHSNHIPQPPHSAGTSYQGLRPRIDPAQVPSPIEAIEVDRRSWETRSFMTLPGTHAPLCTSDFTAVDQGNASPKFIRMSTWNMPSTSRLANDCHIPIVAAIQPFAELDPSEDPVPIIDTGPEGPPRCEQCRAYINPWVTWVAGGNRWKCNLCAHETQVSPEYFSNLDANMLRLDHLQRPELNKGVIDFDVSQSSSYWALNPLETISRPYYTPLPTPSGPRPPQPVDFLFMFDVTHTAITSGFLASACESVKSMLFEEMFINPYSRIGIMTFDRTLHFYDLTSDLTPMLVVADLEEVFAPANDVFFVNPQERRSSIESLLDAIPTRFQDFVNVDSCLGSAIRGGLATLQNHTGHIIVFQSTLPTLGAGALPTTPPPENDYYDTDKEKLLHAPRSPTWLAIADECVEAGITVSLFLAPEKYMDVGSVSVVSKQTGGGMFWFPRFVPGRDSAVMKAQISRVVGRMQGYDCDLIVRCSNGLRVKKYHGPFVSTPTQVRVPHLCADTAFVARLEHSSASSLSSLSSPLSSLSSSFSSLSLSPSSALSPRAYAHVQCAVLYTSVEGRRRVRVINLALNVVELAGNVFQYADLETVVGYFAKEGKLGRSLLIREELTEKCASILLGYRKMCAAATKSTQLIIPEAFRALPAYTLALQKTKPLKARQVSSDVRNYHIHRILSMNLRTLMHYLYPRLLALHDLDDVIALPQEVRVSMPAAPNASYDTTAGEGYGNPSYPTQSMATAGEVQENYVTLEKTLMPSCMRAGYFFMEPGGLYLIDNEEQMIFWIGQGVNPKVLNDLFGVDDVSGMDVHMHALPRLPTTLSTQVHNIIEQRRVQRGIPTKMLIARQDMDASEIEFSDMLVEDQNNGAMSYIDYLALVHKQIANVLNNGGAISGGTASIRQTPW